MDALGLQFTSLDALIQHAFVQEQRLLCKRSAPGCKRSAPDPTDSDDAAKLCNVQGARGAAKRVRFDEQVVQQWDNSCNSGRTELEQRIYQLGMEFGVCGGCLGFLGEDESHFWQDCPLHPKNAEL